MATNQISRRRLLFLGLLTCAGAALPASAVAAPDDPGWLGEFSKQLGELSTWVRREPGANGVVELHCGMRDAAAWARSFSRLAAKDTMVHASGNVLTLSRGGRSLRVVMHQASV